MPTPKHPDAIHLLVENLGISTRSGMENFREETEHCLYLLEQMKIAIESGGQISKENARTVISFLTKISNASLAAATGLLIQATREY